MNIHWGLILAGTFYYTLWCILIGAMMFSEVTSINRKASKDNINLLAGAGVEWSFFILGLFWFGSDIVC